ncbi:glycosyltransferase [Agromyces protaetiae]|uniref:Glycosyltransferase n=1 Tax=Agromyces protaetiae TaxID=2509455 RepID=A0A4P6FJ12_9MICO|nr:glycosyltransferase [Agromyces protaetiae]
MRDRTSMSTRSSTTICGRRSADGSQSATAGRDGDRVTRPDGRVSVALGTHNGARFLEPQLRSILGQTRPVDELVVSDDASADGTIELAERLVADHERAAGAAPILVVLRNPSPSASRRTSSRRFAPRRASSSRSRTRTTSGAPTGSNARSRSSAPTPACASSRRAPASSTSTATTSARRSSARSGSTTRCSGGSRRAAPSTSSSNATS